MKNKWKWVYNPFEFVAGWKAFGIGIVILGLTTIVGYFGNMVFYGFQAKVVPYITWSMAFSLQGIGLAVLVTVMFVTALFFAKHVRFQDILGTVTLAKYPLLLLALLCLIFSKTLTSIDVNKLINMEFSIFDIVVLFLLGIGAMILLVWEIALLYNAFRVSTNLKGVKCALLLTAILLVSEIATIVLILLIY